MTPVTVRCSTLGRLAAFLLIVLIVSPVTAPFSAMPGELQASPSGVADGVNGETKQTDAVLAVVVVHAEPSWCAASFRALAPTAVVKVTHVNRILRL